MRHRYNPPKVAGEVRQIEATNDPSPEEPISEIVHVIIGGVPKNVSQAFWKAKARRIPPFEPREKRLGRDEIITFSEADAIPNQIPHTDAFIIRVIITSIAVRRVFVDTGASVSIMYLDFFRKMRLDHASLKPSAPLQSFTLGEVQPEGTILLPTKVGPYPRQHVAMVNYYVVDSPLAYNIILGRDWLTPAKAVYSTYHLLV